MKPISIRLSSRAEDKYKDFKSLYGGVSMAAESWPFLRLFAIQELKRKLKKGEIAAIADAYNGIEIDVSMSTPAIVAESLRDAEEFEKLSLKWEINMNELIKKVESLTTAQTYFLILEVHRFWSIEEKTKDFHKLWAIFK